MWNNYNRVPGSAYVQDTGAAWNVAVTTPGPLNASNNNRISILHGLDDDAVEVLLEIRGVSAASQQLKFGIGLDSTSAFASRGFNSYANGVGDFNHVGGFNGYIGAGFHYLQGIELSTGGTQQARMSDGGAITAVVWW